MPELPEVENIKLGLEKDLLNRKIVKVKVLEIVKNSHLQGKKTIIKDNIEEFIKKLTGKKIISIIRRGKYLYFSLDKGYLITHFGMTGAYFLVRNLSDINNKNYFKHMHIIFNLDDGKKLVYSDIRRFGELRYVEDINNFKPFVNLAPEPFNREAITYFLEKIKLHKYSKREIKPLLLEGDLFCGCGNIYACEVLYKEKISPLILAKDLSDDKKIRLFKSLVQILKFSVEKGGSTISDYVHSDGGEGKMQNFLQIYGKKECPLGHKVETISQKGRTTYYCPNCQK